MRAYGRRGAAMTETALMCLFIYAPVLMMVLVWGDLSLDKQRAHVAAAYMAFRADPVSDEDLVERYFPLATGTPDNTLAQRMVGVGADEAEPGPHYVLPEGAGDYPSGAEPQFDLQYKLYAIAAGNMHVVYEFTILDDGSPGFLARVEHDHNSFSHYLTTQSIIEMGEIETPDPEAVGGEITIGTTSDPQDYTDYVETITRLLNGEWAVYGGTTPRLESRSGLWTQLRSPFLATLSEDAYGQPQTDGTDPPLIDGEPGVEMRFGQIPDRSEDDAFRTGYARLRNPDLTLDLSTVRSDLEDLHDGLFTGVGEMPDPLSVEREETTFLTPGDPRPQVP